MRILGLVLILAGGLVLLGAGPAEAPPIPAASATPSQEPAASPAPSSAPAAAPPSATGPAAPAPVRTEDWRFDVFEGQKKVGRMRLRITTVRDILVLDEDFAAPFKGEDAGFESQIVYKGAAPPVPQRAKVTSRVGSFKLMEGAIAFAAIVGEGAAGAAGTGGGLVAKETAIGYADKDRQPFAKPQTVTRQVILPAAVVLNHAAFLWFAPRLLTRAGRLDKVTCLVLPADIEFPERASFAPDAVLERRPITDDGRVEFALKRVYPGGNTATQYSMTTDRKGRVLEARLGKFVLRAEAPDAKALLPEPPKPAPTK